MEPIGNNFFYLGTATHSEREFPFFFVWRDEKESEASCAVALDYLTWPTIKTFFSLFFSPRDGENRQTARGFLRRDVIPRGNNREGPVTLFGPFPFFFFPRQIASLLPPVSS